MTEKITAEKPRPGNIRLSQGQATIELEDGPVPFGIDFVCQRMRLAARNSRQGLYAQRLRQYVRDLRAGGLRAVPDVQAKLKVLGAGSDVNKDCVNAFVSWLGNIMMFRRVRTGMRGKSTVKKYEENYGKIVWADSNNTKENTNGQHSK